MKNVANKKMTKISNGYMIIGMARVLKFIVYQYLSTLLANHSMKLQAIFIKTKDYCYLL